MKFTQLDRRMRVYETSHDHRVLPGLHMVVRIDGRSFSTLTADTERFERPYDEDFRDAMLEALVHLVTDSGFGVLFGYTQSDEMSLLLRRDEALFGRKLRKIVSVLAGEASAKFALALGTHAAFDARVSQLPDTQAVVDYFRWRQEDAHRNALNGHAYWLLRRQGLSEREATARLEGVSVSGRNQLLFENGIQFNEVPLWHRRGIGVRWGEVEHEARNPKTGKAVTCRRRRAIVDLELPMKTAFEELVRGIVEAQ